MKGYRHLQGELGELIKTDTWAVFLITLQMLFESAHIFLGLEETRNCMRNANYVYPKRSLTWQHEGGGELHIRNIDDAKPGLRDHVGKIT